jgi:hypothetical protein
MTTKRKVDDYFQLFTQHNRSTFVSNWAANLEKILAGTASKEEFIDAISYWLGTHIAQKVSNLEEAISRKVSWKFSNGLVFSVGTDMHPTLSSLLEQSGEDDDKPVPEDQLDSWAWSASVSGWFLKVDKYEFPDAIQILELLEGLEEENGASTLLIPWGDSWVKRFVGEASSDDENVQTMHKLCSTLLSGELKKNSPWELVIEAANESISEWSDYNYFRRFLGELENRRIAIVALDIPVDYFNDAGLTELRQTKPALAELPAVGIFSEGIGGSFFGNGTICVSVDTSSSVEVEQQFRELTDELELDNNQDDDVFDEGWEPVGSVIFESDLWYSGVRHWSRTQRAIKRYASSVDALAAGIATEEQLVEALTQWIQLVVPEEGWFYSTPMLEAVSKRTCWLFPNDLLLVVSRAPVPVTLVSLSEVVSRGTSAPVNPKLQKEWYLDPLANGWGHALSPLPRASKISSLVSMLTQIHGKPKLILPWAETWAEIVEEDDDAPEFTAAHKMFEAAIGGSVAKQSPWEVEFAPADAYFPATCTYKKFVSLLEQIEARNIAIVVRDAWNDDTAEQVEHVRSKNPTLAHLPVVLVFCNWGEANFFGNGRIIEVELDSEPQDAKLEAAIRTLAQELKLDLDSEMKLSFW